MATKIKKEDFDKYSIKGFKIGDTIWIKEADAQCEIIAVDLDEDCTYGVMVDATQINFSDDDFIDVTIKDCRSDSVYYRKKALKEKYSIWVNADKVEHVWVTHTRKDVLDSEQEECDNVEVDADAFMIEDYLKDDSDIYLEFYLKPKYASYVSRNSKWNNETYTDSEALVEVSYEDAKYMAIVFDPNYSSHNEELLGTFLKLADRISAKDEFHRIIVNSIAFAYGTTRVKDLIESIVGDLYVEAIIHSYRWNSNGMCAVLVEI